MREGCAQCVADRALKIEIPELLDDESLELEPTTENAMKYLVYKTVEMENTMPAVYYGTVEKVFGFTPIINMQNKLNDIVHTYQIRPFTKNKRKLYNLFYVELKSNTVEQINGPLTKKSGICCL